MDPFRNKNKNIHFLAVPWRG